MRDNTERRIFAPTDDYSVRALQEDNKRILEGYAAVFEERSKLIFENNKVFYEIIERGAFDEVLKRDDLDVIFTRNHDRDTIMARTSSGTAQLSADDYGLKYRVEMPNTSVANDVWELVSRGDLAENSFIFSLTEDQQTWSRDESGNNLRRILSINNLIDVSIVSSGAYANTNVAQRCFDDYCKLQNESEERKNDTIYINELENNKDKLTLLKLK